MDLTENEFSIEVRHVSKNETFFFNRKDITGHKKMEQEHF